jgi:hypothetical protein
VADAAEPGRETSKPEALGLYSVRYEDTCICGHLRYTHYGKGGREACSLQACDCRGFKPKLAARVIRRGGHPDEGSLTAGADRGNGVR